MTHPTFLDRVVAEALGPDHHVASAVRGPVGNGQETWFCTVATPDGTIELVARRTAPSGPLDWTDRGQEFRVLRWLETVDIPTPAVWHFDAGTDGDARAVIVMERMSGAAAVRASAEERPGLVADLGRAMARLHALDVAEAPFDAADDRATRLDAELATWEARYRDTALEPIPLLGALLAWLGANRPVAAGAAVVLWGDPGLHNALADEGAITALLDWELAHTGDPLEDVGAAVWSVRSSTDPEPLLAAYEEATGMAVDRARLQWYVAYAAVTRALMLVNGRRNLLDGNLSSPTLLGLTMAVLPDMLLDAVEAAGWDVDTEPWEPAPTTDGRRPRSDEIDDLLATFLADHTLDAMTDRAIRRHLKTAIAVLRSNARHQRFDDQVRAQRARMREELDARLRGRGLDVDRGLEAMAVRIERDETLADLRPVMRRHLVADLRLDDAGLRPLRELYGR